MESTATPMQPLWRQITWWVLLFPAALALALALGSLYLLNWVHVLSGVLWTGADLFMGFIVGPVIRSLDMRGRMAVITYLVPRTLLYFPAVALAPERERIVRLNRYNIWLSGAQGVMQLGMILIMAHFRF